MEVVLRGRGDGDGGLRRALLLRLGNGLLGRQGLLLLLGLRLRLRLRCWWLLLLVLVLDHGRHGRAALVLHVLLNLGVLLVLLVLRVLWVLWVLGRRVGELELRRLGRRAGGHLLGGLRVVEGWVGHVGIVGGLRGGLRGVGLGWREVGAGTAHVRARAGARQMARLW